MTNNNTLIKFVQLLKVNYISKITRILGYNVFNDDFSIYM